MFVKSCVITLPGQDSQHFTLSGLISSRDTNTTQRTNYVHLPEGSDVTLELLAVSKHPGDFNCDEAVNQIQVVYLHVGSSATYAYPS